MNKKRKIIILSCMIALLAITAVFNFVLTTAPIEDDTALVVSSANYFSQDRSERVTTRNEELLQLDQIIQTAASGSNEHSQALSMKI